MRSNSSLSQSCSRDDLRTYQDPRHEFRKVISPSDLVLLHQPVYTGECEVQRLLLLDSRDVLLKTCYLVSKAEQHQPVLERPSRVVHGSNGRDSPDLQNKGQAR